MRRRERWLAVLVACAAVAALLAYVGPAVSIGSWHFGRSASGSPTTTSPATTSPPPSTAPSVELTSVPPTASAATTAPPSSSTGVAAATAIGRTALRVTAAAGWVTRENARPGTTAWRIESSAEAGWIEGFARVTSARPGDAVPLLVDTDSPTWWAEVYRMGYYGGAKARLVWTSPRLPGLRQPPPVVDPATGLAAASGWSPSLVVPVGDDWPPGLYLVKLVSSGRGASYVPLTVRDDDAVADVLIMNAVTTWQAYNPWGGCSLYRCRGVKDRSRAVKVSFDRPYPWQWNGGSANFLDHELPLVSFVEELGIDAAYATSIDVHETPSLVMRYRGAFSLGHDEYYSRAMRDALVAARDGGVNLAFFGANAIYRHIRFEPAADGRANRTMVNYRSTSDPIAATDASDVTVEWRTQQAPEAALVGVQYICAGVRADLVVQRSSHWIWAGAGVRDGQALPELVGNEADAVARGVSPANVETIASSPVTCGKTTNRAHSSYYAAPSGAGVFASGTIWWVCALEAAYCSTAANVGPVRAATGNVVRAFAQPRAGATRPSAGTAATAGSSSG